MMTQHNSDDPAEILKRILDTKKAMDRAYMQLGRDLYLAFHRRLFIDWGYDSFKDFVEQKIGESHKRAMRSKRIWEHFVKECSLRPSALNGLAYVNALQLLPVTDRSNAAARVAVARKMTCRELETQIKVWNSPSADDVADLPPVDDDDEDSTPAAGAATDAIEPDDGREVLTFRLYPGQSKVVDAAIAEAQRAKDSGMAPNEALANMATEFLASRMAKENEPVTRLTFMLGVLERVYGGKIIWIPSDEASDYLIGAMEKRPDLFPDPESPNEEND
jgi:hypothetical protein